MRDTSDTGQLGGVSAPGPSTASHREGYGDARGSRWSRFRERRPSLAGWVAEGIAPLFVLLFAAWKYAPVSLGDMPVARDHSVHLFKAWLTEDVLSRGSVIGWSHLLDSGYPVNGFYPPGGSLWVLAVRAATLNFAGREAAYAVAVFLACALVPLGLYAIARRPLGRTGATVAAVLSAAEVGGWYQGGWDFSIGWGVWGTAFAVGLGLCATALLGRAIRRGSTRALVGAALLASAAVLAHPFGLLALALLAPLRLLQLGTAGDRPGDPRPAPGPLLLRAAAFGALAFAGCSFWLVPYAVRAGRWANSFGEPWLPLPTLVAGLFDGTTLDGVSMGWVIAGLVGPLVALAAGRRFGLYALALFASGLVAGALSGQKGSGLALLIPSFAQVQGERFAYVMRAALWLGLGAGVAGLIDLARRAGEARWRRARGLVTVLPIIAAAALLASPAGAWIRAPFPPVPLASADEHHAAVKEAAVWLREHTSDDPFYRVLVHVRRGHSHGLLHVGTFAGVAVAKTGFHAAETFRNLGAGLEPEALATQDVRFVLTTLALPRDDLALRGRFGPLYLYEFSGYRPARAELLGPGSLRIDRIAPEELAVTVDGAGPESRLRFHVAPYATWEARVNGRVVPWRGAAVGPVPVLDVPAENGSVVLRSVPRSLDRLAQALTALGILAVLAVAVGSSRRFRAWRHRGRGSGPDPAADPTSAEA